MINSRNFVVTLLAFLGVVTYCPMLLAQPVALPPELTRALDENVRHLTPLSLAFEEAKREPSWKPEQVKVGPFVETRFRYRVIVQEQRFYSRYVTLDPEGRAVEGSEQEVSFDGETLYMGGVDKTLLAKRVPRPGENWLRSDYFVAIGLPLPDPPTARLIPTVLAVAATGGRGSVENVTLDGRASLCVRIHVENRERKKAIAQDVLKIEESLRGLGAAGDRIKQVIAQTKSLRGMPELLVESFFFDPDMNYALRKWEQRTPDGTLFKATVNDDFTQLKGRVIWLPRRVTYGWYWGPNGPSDVPSESHVITVSEALPDSAPAAQFVLDYSAPGTHVVDRTRDLNGEEHIVPATQQALDRAATDARQAGEHHTSWSLGVVVLITLGILVLACCIIWFIVRRRAA